MTTINLTLLLGFSLKNQSSEKKTVPSSEKKSSDETKIKEKINKTTTFAPTPSELKIQQETIIVKPKNLFEVGSPKKFAHIEYELLPDRVPLKIDVNCWGSFAKIYSENGVRIIRTIQTKEIAWVPVKIKHFFKQMSKAELLQLQLHVIKFAIWNQHEKLLQEAKSEKARAFYIFQENLENNEIVEAFEKQPSDDKPYRNYLKEEQLNVELDLFKKCAFRGDMKSTYLAYLNYFPDEVHDHMIKKIIQNLSDGIPIRCKEFVRVWSAATTSDTKIFSLQNLISDSKSKSKLSQGSSSSTKRKPETTKTSSAGSLSITVSGETFFTEPNLSVHHLVKHDREICDGYVLITVRNLMSRSMKNEMNPLVINVKKVARLPLNILEKHGFQWIRTMYNVPQIAQCLTTEKRISETVHINESHVFFLENAPECTLHDFFCSKQFVVELVGIRKNKEKSSKKSSLFGTETKDITFGKRLQPIECLKSETQENAVKLAVASYDISALLQCSWNFNVECQCTTLDAALSTKTNDPMEFTDTFNAQELNLADFYTQTPSVYLTDDILLDFGTSIALEMFLQAPQTSLLKCPTLPSVYQRLIVITEDNLLAINLLNQILLHNQKFLTPEVVTPNYLKSGLRVMFDKETTDIYCVSGIDENKDVVTGFLLDNVTSYIFFVEGTPTGLVTTLWNQVMNLPPSIANIHFNSKHVFSNRLYTDFLPFGGFYSITLQTCLKTIMSKTHLYLKGNAPQPCWEALKRFDLMLHSKIIKNMCQLNLLPSAKQLLSLDMEFGVPLRWVKPVDDVTEEEDVQ